MDVFCLFRNRLSKAKPPFDILRVDIRYSAVRCSDYLNFHVRVPGFRGPGYGFDNPEPLNPEPGTLNLGYLNPHFFV